MKIAVNPLRPSLHIRVSLDKSQAGRIRLFAIPYGIERLGDQEGLLGGTELRRKK